MNANIDYCGVIHLLRGLVKSGKCTEKDAKKIANRIAVQWGVDIIITL